MSHMQVREEKHTERFLGKPHGRKLQAEAEEA
jgi:hypothetical protein